MPPAIDLPRVVADAGSAQESATVDAGRVEPALVAPPGATSWQTNGLTLEAGGREIVVALIGDFDGDGRKDALAIARPVPADRKPGSSTGDLLFFHGGGGGPAGAIASGPALGTNPSCTPTARLERIGPRSAFAEIGSSCVRGLGERALAVVRLGPPMPQIAFDAVVLDPRDAPKLTVDVDVADRDHDGIDDVVLRIALEATDGGPRVNGRLAFFDRPAGPSRDPDEPEASLRAVAAQAERAIKGKDVATAPPLVQQLRALYRAVCLEGGAARVTRIHGGTATACGPSKALEDAGVAEVRALIAQGDLLRAVAAADVVQLTPATRTPAKTAELQKIVADAAPAIDAKGVRTVSVAVDVPRDGHPEWGPLAFEPGGKLLVRSGKGVVRVDPESGESEPADVPPWSADVVSPDGKSRWIEATHACEGVALRATFAPTGAGEASDVLLPIAPRLGRTCSGGRGDSVSVIPLAWGASGLEAVVAGQPVVMRVDPPIARAVVGFGADTPPFGSPRSHGGKTFVLPVSSGLLTRSADRWSTVRSSDLEPYTELRGCTINDDATRIACVRRRAVAIVVLP